MPEQKFVGWGADMSLRLGEASTAQRIADAHRAYGEALQGHKNAIAALERFDRWPHPELSEEERLAQHDNLVYLKEAAQQALSESAQVKNWMMNEMHTLAAERTMPRRWREQAAER